MSNPNIQQRQFLRQADDILRACDQLDKRMLAEVGDAYLDAGRPEKALEIIEAAGTADASGDEDARLQMVMARCYEKLDRRDSYVSIYSQVAGRNDPLYGKVAQEKLDEINFNAVMQKEM